VSFENFAKHGAIVSPTAKSALWWTSTEETQLY
jgi:hypothetical protein